MNRRFIALTILFCMTVIISGNLFAQQRPDKRSPQAKSEGQTNTTSENSNEYLRQLQNAQAGGHSDLQSAPAKDCICARNRLKRRLFQRKCKVHPQFDASSLNNPFEEIPLGLQVTETMKVQVRNFEDTRQIFYHYDFVDGKPELNFAGRAKLAQVSRNAMVTFAPIIVEATPRQPGLDQTRRLHIVQTLASNAIPIPGERVVVNGPQARGTSGPDAIILYNQSLNQLNNGVGGMGGSSGAGVGGLSGSGLLPNMQQAGGNSGDNGN